MHHGARFLVLAALIDHTDAAVAERTARAACRALGGGAPDASCVTMSRHLYSSDALVSNSYKSLKACALPVGDGRVYRQEMWRDAVRRAFQALLQLPIPGPLWKPEVGKLCFSSITTETNRRSTTICRVTR